MAIYQYQKNAMHNLY